MPIELTIDGLHGAHSKFRSVHVTTAIRRHPFAIQLVSVLTPELPETQSEAQAPSEPNSAIVLVLSLMLTVPYAVAHAARTTTEPEVAETESLADELVIRLCPLHVFPPTKLAELASVAARTYSPVVSLRLTQ